jgi:hypothetical protein
MRYFIRIDRLATMQKEFHSEPLAEDVRANHCGWTAVNR